MVADAGGVFSDAEVAATLGAGSEGIICQHVDYYPAAQSTDAVSTRNFTILIDVTSVLMPLANTVFIERIAHTLVAQRERGPLGDGEQ